MKRLLTIIGPGLLVAATGVGAGDLWTAAFTGTNLGVTVLWAVVLGAFFKFVLNEGLTRWQLATGMTVLEGAVLKLGKPVQYAFIIYLLAWSMFVGAALANACGVVANVMRPASVDTQQGKLIWGIVHVVVGVALVRIGSFKLFEKIMATCIVVMFVAVVLTAALFGGDPASILSGLTLPHHTDLTGQGLGWTIALMGGVGGTLTVLCYGYWIRQQQRQGEAALRICRIDLAVGYTVTALFGIAMVVIGSHFPSGVKGSAMLIAITDRLAQQVGVWARWVFLIGAWAAVFSSLLGVWQAVPYIFADYIKLSRCNDPATFKSTPVDTAGPAYRYYLTWLAVISMVGLMVDFKQVQKYYALIGALFMPMLAAALLVLNSRHAWVGQWRNKLVTNLILIAIVVFFAYAGWLSVSAVWLK